MQVNRGSGNWIPASTCHTQAYDTYPILRSCRHQGLLISRRGLKVINKSKEKMRCKKKTEAIIPSKLKVLWQGVEGDRKGGGGALGKVSSGCNSQVLEETWREEGSFC